MGIGPYISLRPRPLDKSLLVLRTTRRASQELLSLCFQPDFKHAISFGSEVVMLSYDTNEKRGGDQLSAGSSLRDSLVVPSSSRPAPATMNDARKC